MLNFEVPSAAASVSPSCLLRLVMETQAAVGGSISVNSMQNLFCPDLGCLEHSVRVSADEGLAVPRRDK